MINSNDVLKFIGGPNFSGRSNYLKELSNFKVGNNCQFIGEIPSNFISGMAPTVYDELRLHRIGVDKPIDIEIDKLIRFCEFEQLFERNPYSLSGGEQTLLAILTHLMLYPSLLAIDTSLEQLNEVWYRKVLDTISRIGIETHIVDNRISYYGINESLCLSRNKKVPELNANSFFVENFCGDTIRVQSLGFKYRVGKEIFSDLNIILDPNFLYHLRGLNGSGKSTFAKLLSGVLKPNNGRILLNEKEFNSYLYPGQLFAYSFQDPDEQLFATTVFKEIGGETNLSKAYMLAESFGLTEILDKHPQELPFVLRKRLSIAATLAMDCKWYIFDEPTLGQDDETVTQLENIFLKLKDSGRGIIIISHFEKILTKFMLKNITLEGGKIYSN